MNLKTVTVSHLETYVLLLTRLDKSCPNPHACETVLALLVLIPPVFFSQHNKWTVKCGFVSYYCLSRMLGWLVLSAPLCSPLLSFSPALWCFFICVLVCMTAPQVSTDFLPSSFFITPFHPTCAQHLNLNAAAKWRARFFLGFYFLFFCSDGAITSARCIVDQFSLRLDVFSCSV